MAELESRIVRLEKDGSKTFIPREALGDSDLTVDSRARLVLGTAVGAALAIGAVNLAANGINFVRDCANESIIRMMTGFPPVDWVACLKELPLFLKIIK